MQETITNEPIDWATQSDRAIETACAEQVLGWHMETEDSYWPNTVDVWRDKDGNRECTVNDWRPLTKMGQAWLLVDKLTHTTKQWFHIDQHSTAAISFFEVIGAGLMDYSIETDELTPERAICIGALQAVQQPYNRWLKEQNR